MELALSLGDTQKPFSFHDKPKKINLGTDLGFCMAVDQRETCSSSDPPVQLDLLPFSPVHRNHDQPSSNKLPFPWLIADKLINSEPGRDQVNRRVEEGEEGADLSSPNSTRVSSIFQMDFSIFNNNNNRGVKRDFEADRSGTSNSRGSDDEEINGSARKKLRLTKEQSAFLEDSFKEHNTLNPKQKLALAKQLNLRPRQVEVWFQNRRARTKLKQTEVDCEYLKRCCETLTEENKRLQKELQELRALKANKPFYMQLPATTLTMCPSCERVATTSAIGGPAAANHPASTAAAANKPSENFPILNATADHAQKTTS